ncbi:hypothetical protein ACFSC4_22960 [Deinococcus malanensis]|uniref:hypothetical protein n=1 Tax=Deinococcus malanensis TaxID=1706855 RepID=UPI003644BA21
MLNPDTPDDQERLDHLHRYLVLDTPPEAEFDRITRFVKPSCASPSSSSASWPPSAPG